MIDLVMDILLITLVFTDASDFTRLSSFPIVSAAKVSGKSIEDVASEFSQHSQISISQFEDHIRLIEVALLFAFFNSRFTDLREERGQMASR